MKVFIGEGIPHASIASVHHEERKYSQVHACRLDGVVDPSLRWDDNLDQLASTVFSKE